MSIIHDILKVFGEVEDITQEENFDIFKLDGALRKKPDFDTIESKLPELLEKFDPAISNISLTFTTSQPVIIRNTDDIATKISDLKDGIELYDEEAFECDIDIRITKVKKTEIYNFGLFIDYLENSEIYQAFYKFSEVIRNDQNIFNIWEDIESQHTENISFISKYPIDQSSNPASASKVRNDLLEKRNKCSHFSNGATIEVVPEDFHALNITNSRLQCYLSTLEKYLSIIFLSDFSQIEGNKLTYRIKGYKLISGTLDKNKISDISSNELYDIYKWTYNEGNLIDKIGLSRNIISIHTEEDSICKIQVGASNSVKSSYDLYLKENVKQYIEIKNKISEFIQSQSDKASDMTKNMFSSMKTSLWTFVTFFISVFLMRAFSKNQDIELFSGAVFTISIALILFSFIYMLISIVEINTDKKRLLQKYSDVKDRYTDLLNKSDLDKIIDTEKEKEKEGGYIDKKKGLYTCAWSAMNIILLILVLFLKYTESNDNRTDYKRPNLSDKVIAKVIIDTNKSYNHID